MTLEADAPREIVAAMNQWIDAVTCGMSDAPDRVLALYAPEAVLWATFSPHIRTTHEQIRDYFVHFTVLSNLKVTVIDPRIRIYGDVAINSGAYTFQYEKEGEIHTVPGRYSLTYVRKPEGWLIVDHHSSLVPEPMR